jgi:hypothetical protein
MTQDKNEGSENLNWMEIAETDAINEVRHSGQRLPFIAAAVSLLVIGCNPWRRSSHPKCCTWR